MSIGAAAGRDPANGELTTRVTPDIINQKDMIMRRIDVNREAPVVEAAEVDIEAPVEAVWRILADLEKWPAWNGGVSKIRVNGPIEVGTSFEWVGGGFKIVSRLEEVAPPARIGWTGKMLGIRAVHIWEFQAEGPGTRVRTEESFEGWPAALFRTAMRKTLKKTLDQGLAALKAEAERPGRG